MTPAAIPPVTGTVTSHATIILRNNDQSTLCLERMRPIATTLPTLQCVVLIGIERFDATRTVKAVEISMMKPLSEERNRMMWPTRGRRLVSPRWRDLCQIFTNGSNHSTTPNPKTHGYTETAEEKHPERRCNSCRDTTRCIHHPKTNQWTNGIASKQ